MTCWPSVPPTRRMAATARLELSNDLAVAVFAGQQLGNQGGVLHARSSSIGSFPALVAAAAFALVASAEAQEYCVACADPPAVYRCVIEGARPGGSLPLSVLCVTAM